MHTGNWLPVGLHIEQWTLARSVVILFVVISSFLSCQKFDLRQSFKSTAPRIPSLHSLHLPFDAFFFPLSTFCFDANLFSNNQFSLAFVSIECSVCERSYSMRFMIGDEIDVTLDASMRFSRTGILSTAKFKLWTCVNSNYINRQLNVSVKWMQREQKEAHRRKINVASDTMLKLCFCIVWCTVNLRSLTLCRYTLVQRESVRCFMSILSKYRSEKKKQSRRNVVE